MIGLAGAGAFGTALAVSLSAVQPVMLWARDPEAVAAMRNTRRAPRLPDVELPAAITPPGNAARIFETPSIVVSSRRPSSSFRVTSRVPNCCVFLSATAARTVMGTISSLNLPAAAAAQARCWL